MAKVAVHNKENIPIKPPYSTTDLLERINIEIHAVARAYYDLSNKPGKSPTNGYFCLRSGFGFGGRVLLVSEIGDNPPEKANIRCFNAQEKGERLFAKACENHVSSWQSRDPDHKIPKWGGAIDAGNFILSFSGLPELADETLMALVALQMGWTRRDIALGILAISNNDVGQDLIERKRF